MIKPTLLSLFILISLSIHGQARFDFNSMSRQKDRDLQMMLESSERERAYQNQLYSQQAEQVRRTIDGMGKPSCQEAYNTIVTHASLSQTFTPTNLDSRWLKKVQCFTYQDRIFVIATMQVD